MGLPPKGELVCLGKNDLADETCDYLRCPSMMVTTIK